MKFTFGIVTDGNQLERVNKIIDSIEEQCISSNSYEIVVVTLNDIPYNRSRTRTVKLIDQSKPMWITKKKNIITQLASFENVVLLHDYVIFEPGWYQGFLEFGDDWDVCMNRILNADGTRFRDWVWWGPTANATGVKAIDYDCNDYLNKMYISGAYYCVKKNFALQHPLNENLIWGMGEDVEWSIRCRDFWNYRMNKNSSVRLLKQKDSAIQGYLP